MVNVEHMKRMLAHAESVKEKADMNDEPEAAPYQLQSPTIGKLAKALSAAQAEIKAPKKGREATIKSDKGSYAYSYADLADVIECYRAALSKNSLAITQAMRPENGHLVLVTKLLHESGEWISSEFPLRVYDRPQEQGSAITYARRYNVSSLLGIAAEDDDDGKRAQDAPPKKAEPQPIGADAAAIIHLAAELEQHTGKDSPQIIEEASAFTKEGVRHYFTDPVEKQGSPKWLKSTRARMEKDLRSYIGTEPGAAEAADLFTDTARP